MLDVNPAKHGVENPQRRRTKKAPFESWAELEAVAKILGPSFGPILIFAAATGLQPGEWIALEHRDIDRDARVAYVPRLQKGRLKCTKTQASVRAVPLQAIALDALERPRRFDRSGERGERLPAPLSDSLGNLAAGIAEDPESTVAVASEYQLSDALVCVRQAVHLDAPEVVPVFVDVVADLPDAVAAILDDP